MKPIQCMLLLIVISAGVCYAAQNDVADERVKAMFKTFAIQLQALESDFAEMEKLLAKLNNNYKKPIEQPAVPLRKAEQAGRQRRSLDAGLEQPVLNEANLRELSQLVHLFRNGPAAIRTSASSASADKPVYRFRRQSPQQGIISSTATTAQETYQTVVSGLTHAFDNARKRLSQMSKSVVGAAASGVITLNDAAATAVQTATNALGSVGSTIISGVNSATNSASNAITNGVKQVSQGVQNTLG